MYARDFVQQQIHQIPTRKPNYGGAFVCRINLLAMAEFSIRCTRTGWTPSCTKATISVNLLSLPPHHLPAPSEARLSRRGKDTLQLHPIEDPGRAESRHLKP